jgi:hypothetical protein
MNFYTLPYNHYCGVDLHSRTMSLCVVAPDGAPSACASSTAPRPKATAWTPRTQADPLPLEPRRPR